MLSIEEIKKIIDDDTSSEKKKLNRVKKRATNENFVARFLDADD